MLVLASVFCIVAAAPLHLWLGDRSKILQWLYPVEAALAETVKNCSSGYPLWMKEVIDFSLWDIKSPAGQVLYMAPGGVKYECHYGWSRFPLFSMPVSNQTRFRYASMTKLLTADLVLRQVRAGNMALDDQLLEQLAILARPVDQRVQKVTIDHLLRHDSGLDRMQSVDSMVIRNKKPWCPYDATQLAQMRLDFAPGERYAYHNLNYCLLGMLLEQADPQQRSFREQMEQEYALVERDIRFIDGPYLKDEVTYDFRHSQFYGPNYWKYFDFQALSSSMGLSGSAMALASLISSLKDQNGEYPLTQAPVEEICDETAKRGCYGYALFSYKPVGVSLRVHVQPGLLYGAPSLAIIDEHGGVTVWVGNGTRPSGSSTDAMLDYLYAALDDYYAAKSSP